MREHDIEQQPTLSRGTIQGPMARHAQHLALYVEDLDGGGVQRMRLALAGALAERGHRVSLVVGRADGALRDAVPRAIDVIELNPTSTFDAAVAALRAQSVGWAGAWPAWRLARRLSPTLRYLPALASFIRRARPDALLSATPYMNLEALWARRLADVPLRVLISEHNDLSHGHVLGRGSHARTLPPLQRRTYPQAAAVIAVSLGVADDIATRTGIPRAAITTIYNPALRAEIPELAGQPVDHPWLKPGGPPVVLGVGRLSAAKDFPTLIRAFARLRARRSARLIILGKGKNPKKTAKRQRALFDQARSLGVAADLDLPGFVLNPYAYMARAAVLAVSSAHEGFCNVLVEAMACGCPVVSTDCPSGPAEILDHGRFGRLVPVGDDQTLAAAIAGALEAPLAPDLLRMRARFFSLDRAIGQYEQLLLGRGPLERLSPMPRAPLAEAGSLAWRNDLPSAGKPI
ncbi:MAG: glycosyltransferase [Geminicoccaceae bacterium]